MVVVEAYVKMYEFDTILVQPRLFIFCLNLAITVPDRLFCVKICANIKIKYHKI